MNKKELIAAVAARTDVSKTTVEKVLACFASVTVEQLKAGNKVSMPGLGSMETKFRPSRPGRNPRTGEAATVPASTGVKFKPETSVKVALNP